MDRFQALQNFWSSFGLKAYDESTVPSNAKTPYITYSASTAGLNETVMLSASLWYRSTSWSDASEKADEINAEIGMNGNFIKFDDGVIWIVRGTPFAQRMSDEDDSIRRIYINVSAEFISAV